MLPVIVSHEHRFIFVKTRKTAGTSIEVALSQLAGDDAIVTPVQPAEPGHEPRNWRRLFDPSPELIARYVRREPSLAHRDLRRTLSDLRRRRRYYNHVSAALIRARLGRKIWDSYFTFCFERNSWDKAVSWYFYKNAKNPARPPFEQWMMENALPSDWHIYTIGGSVAVDFIGQYERLDEDLRSALAQVGIHDVPGLPRAKGQFRPTDARTVVTPQIDARIRSTFANEIDYFGYAPPASSAA